MRSVRIRTSYNYLVKSGTKEFPPAGDYFCLNRAYVLKLVFTF